MKRKQLVQTVQDSSVTDKRVLNAMQKVPRHKFVPNKYRSQAYEDIALPIGYGQTISQPSLVGLMTQLLKLTNRQTVLEVGTGSGYQAAILSYLAKQVYTVERIPELAMKARAIFKKLEYHNVQVFISDGTLGLPEKAPFDAIIVTAGAKAHIPQSYVDQLIKGGRIVIPVGSMTNQQLVVGVKKDKQLSQHKIGSVRFVPLIGKEGWRINS